MSDVLPTDAALATEIARLKAACSNTRELYREVCVLLFFRFAILPPRTACTSWCARAAWARPRRC